MAILMPRQPEPIKYKPLPISPVPAQPPIGSKIPSQTRPLTPPKPGNRLGTLGLSPEMKKAAHLKMKALKALR